MVQRSPRSILLASMAASALLISSCSTSGGAEESEAPTPTGAETTTAPSETSEPEPTSPETTVPAPADGDICEPLQVLSDYDAQSGTVIGTGDWPTIQEFFVSSTRDVLAAYDDAIALDTELTADLEELRSITEGTSDLAAESTSLNDLSAKLLALPGIDAAGLAGFRLNTFAEENCGFSTGGSGG